MSAPVQMKRPSAVPMRKKEFYAQYGFPYAQLLCSPVEEFSPSALDRTMAAGLIIAERGGHSMSPFQQGSIYEDPHYWGCSRCYGSLQVVKRGPKDLATLVFRGGFNPNRCK